MSQTITIRLSKELADWLARVSATPGVPQGRIVRDQLERAKASDSIQPYMRLAGTVRGPKDLSRRKGFTRCLPSVMPIASRISPTYDLSA